MRTLIVTNYFVIQECCGETRINGVPFRGKLDLEKFKQDIESQGYYADDRILAFKGFVLRKDYRSLILNGRTAVVATNDVIDRLFNEIVEAVKEKFEQKFERRKKMFEALQQLEQLEKKIDELSTQLKELASKVTSLSAKVEQSKQSQLSTKQKPAKQSSETQKEEQQATKPQS